MDWSVFYRAIGIAENIIEPSYYHVLGLTARDCDREKVEKALSDRKRELRQSIPSPEFITLVLQFEKDVLETAAAVLADDEKRAAYNKDLLVRQREIELHNRRKQKLVDDVRTAIAEAVDEKGCLGGVERYLLEEKLRLIEVQEHNIRQILARIPEPAQTPIFDQQRLLMFFAGAVQLSIKDDILGTTEERTLNELAARLGLDAMQARLIVDQQLAQLTARRQGAKTQNVGIVLEKPIRFDEPPEQVPLETPLPAPPKRTKHKKHKTETPTPEDIHEVVEQMHGWSLDRLLRIVAPVLAILIFIAMVIFLNAMVRKRNAVPDMRDILPVDQPSPTRANPAAQLAAPQPQVSQPAKSAVPTVKVVPDVPQILTFDSQWLNYNQLKPSSSLTTDQLLADTAEWMRRIRRSAAGFQQARNKLPNVSSVAAAAIDLESLQQERLGLRLETLKEMLYSDSEADRLHAAVRLGSIHQRPAYDILLEALEDRTITSGSHGVVTAILGQLRQSSSTHVAHRLAQMMERTGRQTAFQIETTLIGMTDITPEATGILPLKNTIKQRQAASQWWQAKLWEWNGASAADSLPPIPESVTKTLELSATIAQLALQTADTLSAAGLTDDEQLTRRLEYKYGFEAPNLALLKQSPAVAVDFLAESLEALVRADADAAIRADAVSLNRQIALLTADGDLQTAVVQMAAANDYLAILAAYADEKGQYRQLLNGFRQANELKKLEVDTALANLRNECRLHALYWDLLLEIQQKGQK